MESGIQENFACGILECGIQRKESGIQLTIGILLT